MKAPKPIAIFRSPYNNLSMSDVDMSTEPGWVRLTEWATPDFPDLTPEVLIQTELESLDLVEKEARVKMEKVVADFNILLGNLNGRRAELRMLTKQD